MRFPRLFDSDRGVDITTFVTCVIAMIFLSSAVQAADCSLADIELLSQAEVDSFQDDYGGGDICDSVSGDLVIDGEDILSLGALSDLTYVGRDLVIKRNSVLASLNGLSAVTEIGRHLDITNNPALDNVEGLTGLFSIGGVLWVRDNDSLVSLSGVSGVEIINLSIVIDDNAALSEVAGLSKLTSLGLHLWIRRNNVLSDIESLSGVSTIGGDLIIGFNPSLASLSLASLTRVDSDVFILDNGNLNDLNQLSNLMSVGNDLFVSDNPKLSNCLGLKRLLDEVDDGVPGPGPGLSGVPDVGNEVNFNGNRQGCNSKEQVVYLIMEDGFESRNQITTVEYYTSQGSCDLAIGSDGFPIIGYGVDEGLRKLKTAKCTDASCTRNGLIISMVDNDPINNVGFINPAIAIGNDGSPLLSYIGVFVVSGWIKTAKCNEPSCLGGDETFSITLNTIKCNDAACSGDDEIVSTVDSAVDNVGMWNSIAIGSDQLPIISYQAGPNGNLMVAKCNDIACSGGDETISTVDGSDNNVGFYSSVAIGVDGFPVIAYVDVTERSLKIAKCNDLACSGGDEMISTIDKGNIDTVSGASIAIGVDGMPIISYSVHGYPSLKVAKCKNPACSSGDETIHRLDAGARWTSIAIGADGLPVIGYCGSVKPGLAVKILHCGTLDCRP